jgi:hypothetical protein
LFIGGTKNESSEIQEEIWKKSKQWETFSNMPAASNNECGICDGSEPDGKPDSATDSAEDRS